MPLSEGERVGPYEVISRIAAGGMGEVWKARDTRLNREVALKTSRAAFSKRFQQEAQAVAALNHPNICTLYDVGPDYLVMEFIEGTTLAERIAKGSIPLDDTLNIARQIADALDAAHTKRIIHRDLKPANIGIRPDGSVKVLDFGLARTDTPNQVIRDSPTMTAQTQPGVLLGTAGYMSPEQARGQPVDKQTDIWAFGTILYEMITGKRLFDGGTISDTLAATLNDNPDLTRAPRDMRRLLASCLEKDRKKRLRDIGDWMLLLDDDARLEKVGIKSKLPWSIAGLAIVVLCASALLLISMLKRRTEANREMIRSTRFSVVLPEGARIDDATSVPTMAISPDGRILAMVLEQPDARSAIWLRPLESEVAHRLDGTDGASLPFWSPDGTEIGFFGDNQLKRIAVSGGPARVLCRPIVAAGGATWGRSGTVVYSSAATLHAVDTSSGSCRQLTSLDSARESRHAWPQFLPDGRRFLYFVVATDPAKNTTLLASLDETKPYTLLMNGSRALFAPPDNLLFVRDGTLFAQQWDSRLYRPLQSAVPLANDTVPFATNVTNLNPLWSGFTPLSVSENGVLAYRTRTELRSQIVSYSREGKRLRSIGAPGPYAQFTLSPDEKTFAFLVAVNPGVTAFKIWLMRHDTEVVSRFDFGHAGNGDPVWGPNSRRIVFSSFDIDEQSDLYEWTIGEDKPRRLLSDGKSNKPDDWSNNGRVLVYRRDNRLVLALAMDSGGKPIPTGDTDFRKDQSQLAPDGKRIAYNSDKSGRQEIYVANFPSFTDTKQVSAEGGVQPLWSNKGDELFYLAPDKNLMSVQVRPGSSFETSAPKPLFRTALAGASWGSQYAVSQDGRRVYVLEPAPTRQDIFHVVTHWNAAK